MKYDQDPQGGILQQVVLGDDIQEGAYENTASSKSSQRNKDKEQRHRLGKINSTGNNADFMRRNLTMLKISSYVLFGTPLLKCFSQPARRPIECQTDSILLSLSATSQLSFTLSSPTKFSLALKRPRSSPSRIKSTGRRTALYRCGSFHTTWSCTSRKTIRPPGSSQKMAFLPEFFSF